MSLQGQNCPQMVKYHASGPSQTDLSVLAIPLPMVLAARVAPSALSGFSSDLADQPANVARIHCEVVPLLSLVAPTPTRLGPSWPSTGQTVPA